MRVFDLGMVDYDAALDFQRSVHAGVSAGEPASIILCCHPPVITLGRRTPDTDIKATADALGRRGLRVVRSDRGGQATYHGPGQQMVYAICDLRRMGRDLHRFLRALERLAVDVLTDIGIDAGTRPGLTGAWAGEKKIASIGIGVRGWISYHGLALNLDRNDLANFELIRPCGMDIGMTCAEAELGRPVARDHIKDIITRRTCHDKGYLA